MHDLNDLRVFERIAALGSFTAAARALHLPRSSVSRSVARLEADLGLRLIQRTTRDMTLTAAGIALRDRLGDTMEDLTRALEYVGALSDVPRGHLTISCGIAFGITVVAKGLPKFLERYPEVSVSLMLESRNVDLVAEGVDVAIRLAPLADSSMVAMRLGTMDRYLCAAPAYLRGRDPIDHPRDLALHQTIEMPDVNGCTKPWSFTRGETTVRHDEAARVLVNEVMAIQSLILDGAGIGILSGYACGRAIMEGQLVRLLPEWSLSELPVSLIFPSRRELAPSVRAFADFMKEITTSDRFWPNDPLKPFGGLSDQPASTATS